MKYIHIRDCRNPQQQQGVIFHLIAFYEKINLFYLQFLILFFVFSKKLYPYEFPQMIIQQIFLMVHTIKLYLHLIPNYLSQDFFHHGQYYFLTFFNLDNKDCIFFFGYDTFSFFRTNIWVNIFQFLTRNKKYVLRQSSFQFFFRKRIYQYFFSDFTYLKNNLNNFLK